MKNYNIEKVKTLFNENKYKELVQIVNEIRNLGNYDKEDIKILNYLFKNKDVDTCLYEIMMITYEEFKNKFMKETKKENLEDQIDQVLEIPVATRELKSILSDKKIMLTEYKLYGEERPKISIKLEEQTLPYIYNIMKTIYKAKVNDLGFEMISLKSLEYDIFTIYLLPAIMLDDVVENQINQMKKILIDSILMANPTINYEYDLPREISEFMTYFNGAKARYFYENFKVCYIRSSNKDKFYLATSTKEEILNFCDKPKTEYLANSKIVSFDNKPYVSSKNSAYVNNKTIGFVLFLTILVIIAVSILTLR